MLQGLINIWYHCFCVSIEIHLKNSTEKPNHSWDQVRRKPHHIHYVALTKTVHLFSLMKALEQHLLLQDDPYFSKPEDIHKTSDKVKILFAQKLKDTKIAEQNYSTSSIGNDCTSTSGRSGESVHPLEDGKTMGWALRKRRKNARFSEKQICFLVDMYEEGEKTEKKCCNCC